MQHPAGLTPGALSARILPGVPGMSSYPKYVECPACHGRGRVSPAQDSALPHESCATCHGTGWTGATPEPRKCPRCGGSGTLDPNCDYCAGRGGRVVANLTEEHAFVGMLPCTYLTPAEREAERIQREKELASQAFSRGCALSVYGILAMIALFWLVSAVGKHQILPWKAGCIFLAICVPLVILAVRVHQVEKQIPRCPWTESDDYY
jgi:hypothetical protein